YALYERSQVARQTDEANLVEWLDESRVFRKSLPELVREYLAERERVKAEDASEDETTERADEIHEQLKVLADPTRAYQGLLPMFPEIYRLEVRFEDPSIRPIAWVSPAPMPRQQSQNRVRVLDHHLLGESDSRAVLHCEYRLHAFNKVQR